MVRRYRFTASRRASILRAQRISAHRKKGSGSGRKRKTEYVRSKNQVGYWVAKGVNKAVGVMTLGMGSKFAATLEGAKKTQERQMYRWRK